MISSIRSCCFCFGLEKGSQIIGFLHVIFAILFVTFSSFLAADASNQVGTIDDADGTFTEVHLLASRIAGFASIHIVLGIVLIIGSIWRKKFLLITWVVSMICLYIAALVVYLVFSFMRLSEEEALQTFTDFLLGAVFFAVIGHFIVIVYNYYLLLKKEEEMFEPDY